MAIENANGHEFTEKMNMGLPASGKKVIYQPHTPVNSTQSRKPTGIVLSEGSIFAHSYSGIGLKVLYDPITKTILD